MPPDGLSELAIYGFAASLEELVRVEGRAVVATLRRLTGDLDSAEDAVADACLAALETWPTIGIPERPGAWLTTVARRKAIDRMRRESRRDGLEEEAVSLDAAALDEPISYHDVRDDQLRLIFTCCHPALSLDAQVALSLRLLCGLTTTEISQALLERESAVGQRISRAKSKIRANRLAYRVPSAAELPSRVPAVLAVVHLLFTTGHHAPAGSRIARVDLATEGIRLADLLASLMPDEPECVGLAVLLTATWARRSTRVDADGAFVSLRDADRTAWDRETIAAASARLRHTMRLGRPGPYQLQAALSCVHGLAPTFAATDWVEIVALYDLLVSIAPSTAALVNRVVAVAEVSGPEVALVELDELAADARHTTALERWHLYWATRADLCERAGRRSDALAAWQAALAQECNDVDRRFLEQRASSSS